MDEDAIVTSISVLMINSTWKKSSTEYFLVGGVEVDGKLVVNGSKLVPNYMIFGLKYV